MFSLTITEKGGDPKVEQFDQPEITIGRVQGNDIVLPKSNISKRHARIIDNNGAYVVVDSKSTNGTYINGKRIDAPYDIREGDKIYVGDFTLELETQEQRGAPPPPPPGLEEPEDADPDELLSDDEWAKGDGGDEWDDDWGGSSDVAAQEPDAELEDAVEELEERQPEMPLATTPAPDLRKDTENQASQPSTPKRQKSRNHRIERPTQEERLQPRVVDEALDMGPLKALLADEAVAEIMVNGAQKIFVDRSGSLELSAESFSSDEALTELIEGLFASVGQRIDESTPIGDARLKDGTHVNAILPPLALDGPVLTMRKFSKEPLMVDDLVGFGALSAEMSEFLEVCVKARKNILVAGGTASGKTTTLNVLCGFLDDSERIVTIEHVAELKLDQPHVLRLESRPMGSPGAIDTNALLRNALRMRPDRIVLGECQGAEVLDILRAMNMGHDGLMTSVHAYDPQDALKQLSSIMLMSGITLPAAAVRAHTARAIDVIVQQTRFPDGSRRITHISEVQDVDDDTISIEDIFIFKTSGANKKGKVKGSFVPTGFMPRFYEDLKAMGIEHDLAIFQE